MLDLGSGGGLDCLVAARQMLQTDPSPTGKIYGVDRSSKMIELARRNASKSVLPDRLVEFIEAPITKIPLKDASIDLIVSNCVINLVPDADKPMVFSEMHRLLKPGGRLAVSDLLAKKDMPDHVRNDAALLIGCIAGASLVDEYHRWMVDAGFEQGSIVLANTNSDLNVYQKQTAPLSCCSSKQSCESSRKNADKLDFNEWVAAYQIYAVKGKHIS
ncbi:S-adenosyl-L-methionine-dependent methyltransferase [Exophiala viscosa]|uniref:Arsenite methyltransferase n=1 Tax=Exophiala viscosa TaxID=2486360 RepID=A0AAN6IE97_9EURO|nr:S-adenosyl-L-methionine-dependent methyltransferase [Exophiala viscosa]